MSVQDGAFSPFPDGIEPPDPDQEMAAQEALEATAGIATVPSTPPIVVGRTYAMDLVERRFTPDGRQPLSLRGTDAIRLNVEKTLRSERGSAPVHTDQYGLEGTDDLVQGQHFEASEFAEYEQRVNDALLALPYIIAVDSFDVAYMPGDDAVFVTIRVTAIGTGGSTVQLDLENVRLNT